MKRIITLICAYLLLMIPVACGKNSASVTDEGAASEESDVGGGMITQSDSSILVVNFPAQAIRSASLKK